jgi:general secretion pathway protein J
MAIFAVIGALALGGLNTVITQQESARRQLERLHDVQRAMRLLTNDLSQLVPRAPRDALGTRGGEKPLQSPCGFQLVVCLTRDGWRNPFNRFARGTLQRVQYKVVDGELIRESWAVMDRTLVNEPRQEVLLKDVENFELAYLDRASTGDWLIEWPPQASAGVALSGNLQAVRIVLTLKDWGEIVRLVEVVG